MNSFFPEENGKSCPGPGPRPPKNKTYKSYKSYRSYFSAPLRELGFEGGVFFGKPKNFSKLGLTKRKRVVYLCPIAPDDGDVGGCGVEKNPEKNGFLI